MSTTKLAKAILDMAEKDKGLSLGKLEDLIIATAPVGIDQNVPIPDVVDLSHKTLQDELKKEIKSIVDSSGRVHIFQKEPDTMSEDRVEYEFKRGYAQALEDNEHRWVWKQKLQDLPGAAKRHTDQLTDDQANEVKRRLEEIFGLQMDIVQEKFDMETKHGVAVRLAHHRHMRTAIRVDRSWSIKDIADQLAKDLNKLDWGKVPEVKE